MTDQVADISSPIGLIAGGGVLPFAVADSLSARGVTPVLFPLKGFCDPEQVNRFRHRWVALGQFGKMMSAMRSEGCRDIVFIGSLVRPALSDLRLSEAVSHDILTRTYHLFNALHAEPRARCQVVSLDRLLRAPEPQIRTLCAWLGLEFDAAMLDAPQYNHLYPEAGFRSDRAAGAPDGGAADPASRRKLALLQPSYDALLARAA